MSFRLRLAGLIPLCFFLAHLVHHIGIGEGQYILWLCNLNNLLLGFGLLLEIPVLFQAGILWLIPTLPLWFIESWEYKDFPITSILSHAGAVAFGLLFIKRIGMSLNAWIVALVWGLAVQFVCRFLTAPVLNINVAHRAYPGWEMIFKHYWQFWLFVAFEASIVLLLMCLLMGRWFPASTQMRND
jgi:hypothetical protein